MSIEVNNESGVELDEAALADLARFALDALSVSPLAEFSLLLVDDEAMTTLHVQWMELPGPTDVMAFPMDTLPGMTGPASSPGASPPADAAPTLLGDVVICPQVAAEQAVAAGHPVESELALLCVHGVLHLLGYDHGSVEEETEMFGLQSRLLSEWAASTGWPAVRTPLPGTKGEQRR